MATENRPGSQPRQLWNSSYNFCALRPGYDFFPASPTGDLEIAQAMSASVEANKIIRQLLGGTLGHDREPMHYNCRAKVVPMPDGFEKIVKLPSGMENLSGPKWFIPHPLKEIWAECPRCGTMNHFVRTADIGQYFLCSKCR